MTPAQAAGVNLHLNGGNRWLELLKASENSEQYVSQEKEGKKLYVIQVF